MTKRPNTRIPEQGCCVLYHILELLQPITVMHCRKCVAAANEHAIPTAHFDCKTKRIPPSLGFRTYPKSSQDALILRRIPTYLCDPPVVISHTTSLTRHARLAVRAC